MKKITLTVGLLATMLYTNAQDTICAMVALDEKITFNYTTSEIINREHYKGNLFIAVKNGQVLALHLYDEKLRVRKVISTYSNGYQSTQVLDSKDNTYYSLVGPLTIEVGKPKFMILR